MFLRPHFRRRHGRREAYWALVESYRTQAGPRQRTVAYLGSMDEAGRLGVEQAADPAPFDNQRELFPPATEPRYVEIDRTRSSRRELPAIRRPLAGAETHPAAWAA